MWFARAWMARQHSLLTLAAVENTPNGKFSIGKSLVSGYSTKLMVIYIKVVKTDF